MAGAGFASGDDPPDQLFGWSAEGKALGGAVGGALMGGLLGAVVRSEKWELVPLSSLHVAPVAILGGRPDAP